MLYKSTTGTLPPVSLFEAVRHSVGSDGGIYLPDSIPCIPKAFFNNIAGMSLTDIGYVVANMLFGEDVGSETLRAIVKEAINFDIPIRKMDENIHSLELFHGPSGSYKDFGARFMAHIYLKFISKGQKSNILIASRGDAGEAVAKAFYGMENVRVFVIYPDRSDRSAKRRSGFTSLGRNIFPVEIKGTFENCLELVKTASADKELGRKFNLQTANSLNIARLLPQTFYYFYAFARLSRLVDDARKLRLVVAIPMGNLGNLTSGLIAKEMGVPIERFIVSRTPGSPRFLTDYLTTGRDPKDIPPGSVSPNFERLKVLVNNSVEELRRIVKVESVVPDHSLWADKYNFLDNSGLGAYEALKHNLMPDETGIVIATSSPEPPVSMTRNNSTGNKPVVLSPAYIGFRDYLISKALR